MLAVPEIIDPVFAKTSQNARFLLSENERFGLVFVKTRSINSGTGNCLKSQARRKKGFDIYDRHKLGVKTVNRRRCRNWHSKGKASIIIITGKEKRNM